MTDRCAVYSRAGSDGFIVSNQIRGLREVANSEGLVSFFNGIRSVD